MACLLSIPARLWLAYKRTDPRKISVAAATMSHSTGRTMSLRILSSIHPKGTVQGMGQFPTLQMRTGPRS